MNPKTPMPTFATEAEEAQWWFDHRHQLTQDAEAALARGELKLRRLPPSPAAKNVTIRIPEREIMRARELAAKRGLRYQTYLKMLLHEALNAEERKQAS